MELVDFPSISYAYCECCAYRPSFVTADSRTMSSSRTTCVLPPLHTRTAGQTLHITPPTTTTTQDIHCLAQLVPFHDVSLLSRSLHFALSSHSGPGRAVLPSHSVEIKTFTIHMLPSERSRQPETTHRTGCALRCHVHPRSDLALTFVLGVS